MTSLRYLTGATRGNRIPSGLDGRSQPLLTGPERYRGVESGDQVINYYLTEHYGDYWRSNLAGWALVTSKGRYHLQINIFEEVRST